MRRDENEADPLGSLVAAERDHVSALLDSWLPAQQERLGIVGFAAGVMLPGGEAVMSAHGLADRDREVPMTLETPLRLASVTKMFTVTALLLARDRGLLSLDTPVSDLVPDLVVESPASAPAPITLRQCVSHTAGLPANVPPGMQYWDRDEPEIAFPGAEKAREWLRELQLIAPPMTTFHYSNVGFLIAGLALEAAFGQPYEQLMREHVLEPMGMGAAFFGSAAELPRLAVGYRHEDTELRRAPVIDVGWDTAGGGLCCSANDLRQFLALHLSDRPAGGSQVLGGSSVREARQPVYYMPDGRKGVGLGWMLEQDYGESIVMHSGGIAGYDACLMLIPERAVGAFLLSNTNRFQSTPLLAGLLRALMATIQTDRQMAERYQPRPAPAGSERLIGQYANNEITYDVVVAGGRLALVPGGVLSTAAWLEPAREDGEFVGSGGFVEGEIVSFRDLRDGRFTELALQGLLLRRQA